jgi:hypothetical protein
MTTRKSESLLFKVAVLSSLVAVALGACDSQPSRATSTPHPTATPFFIPSPEKLNTPTPVPTPETIQTDLSEDLLIDGSQSIKLTKKDGSNEQWIWTIRPKVIGANKEQTIVIQTNSLNFDSNAACVLTPCVYNGQNVVAGIDLNAYGFSKNNQYANQLGSMDFALSQLKTQGAYLDCKYNSHLRSGKQVIDSFASCQLKYNSNHWTVELVSNTPKK